MCVCVCMPRVCFTEHVQPTVDIGSTALHFLCYIVLLPVRTSEQGNVIGLVSVYIYIYIYIYICHQKKNCN